MDLKSFQFPKLDDVDIAFSTQRTIPELLNEAKERGFYDKRTPYNHLFSKLFFEGGKLNFKKNLPEDFKKDATLYLMSFMRSFASKHEEKEAICAMLLSELVDI